MAHAVGVTTFFAVLLAYATVNSILSTTTPPQTCPDDMVYDIFLILDISDNSNSVQYVEMQNFLTQYFSSFTFSSTHAQFSFTAISNTFHVTTPLGLYRTAQEMMFLLFYTKQDEGQRLINVGSALQIIANDYLKRPQYRPNAHHLILYITTSSYSDDPLSLASQLRTQFGQNFLSIAYGPNANIDKLAQLSGGYDCVLRAGIPNVNLNDVVLQAWSKTCSYISCNGNFETTTLSTATSTIPSPPLNCDIKLVEYVIYLVVDSSSAVSVDDYNELRTLLISFVSGYAAGGNVLFTLLTVSHEATALVVFADLETAIFWLTHHQKQDTVGQNLNEAFLITEYFVNLPLRPVGFPQLLIYVSGTTDFTEGAPYDSVGNLAQGGIKFVAIQYGPRANIKTLSHLVGGTHCVYSAIDSQSRSGMAAWLQNKTCKAWTLQDQSVLESASFNLFA